MKKTPNSRGHASLKSRVPEAPNNIFEVNLMIELWKIGGFICNGDLRYGRKGRFTGQEVDRGAKLREDSHHHDSHRERFV